MLNGLEKKPFSKILSGPRLQLIAASTEHTEALWQSILRDRAGRSGASWRWLTGTAELFEYLSKNSHAHPGHEVVFVLSFKEQIIGTFHIHTICYSDYKTEIGYAIEKSFEGQGFVLEAIHLTEMELVRLGFQKAIINCDVDNARSIRVAERAGFLREGTFLKDCVEDGKFRDSALFGKLL